ncbi:MAG: hypothetical protein KF784_03180 [Fimbriimonadaceae bacterium]|nr:hypothetical protein [Fimbriimonadaceae bacterium]
MLKKLFITLATVLAVTACQAQIQLTIGGNAVNYQALTRKDVASDLALEPGQQTKIAAALKTHQEDVHEEIQSIFSGGVSSQEEAQKAVNDLITRLDVELRKKLSAILTPDQLKRFDQIELQISAVRAFSRENIAKAMDFSADQKKKLDSIMETYNQGMRAINENAQHEQVDGGFRVILGPEDEKKLDQLRIKALDDIKKLMTPEQKKKWDELTGPEFKISK